MEKGAASFFALSAAKLNCSVFVAGLVDELLSSDELILNHLRTHEVIEVRRKRKKTGLVRSLVDLLGLSATASRALAWLKHTLTVTLRGSPLALAIGAGALDLSQTAGATAAAAASLHHAQCHAQLSSDHSVSSASQPQFCASAQHVPLLSAAAIYPGPAAAARASSDSCDFGDLDSADG